MQLNLLATCYSFLIKAGHDYVTNPNPETRSALERAQREAVLFDFAMWMVGFLLLLWLYALVVRDLKRFEAWWNQRKSHQ